MALSPSTEAAAPTCGLTIITHGFESPWPIGNGALPGWVREMARAITNRIGSAIPIYRIRYDKASDTVLIQDGVADIDITLNGGAVILLDWVGVANETVDYPSQYVADKFSTYLFGQVHSGRSLTEIPIHLIGHSRGCSLNTFIAYRLAVNGILIEQVTTLDPHPVRPWHFPPGSDWIPETYINVVFADNYYQPDDFPEGMNLAGAFNQNLTSVLTGVGPGEEHMHVHTYYHGTVNIGLGPTEDLDGDHIVNAWYDGTLPRSETGYNFSRFTNSFLSRPISGINQFISGAGGGGSRVSVESPQQLWSNAGFDQRSTIPSVVTIGQTVSIPYYFADRNSAQTITFYLDADTNPYNGYRSQIGSVNQNSRPAGSIGAATFQWTPTAADIGTHFLRVKSENSSGYARFDYYFKPIVIQAASPQAPTITAVSPSVFTGLPIGQTRLIRVIGSGFTGSSMLTFNDGVNPPYTGGVPTFVSANELDYNISTGTNQANWTVQVINGAQTSNLGHFTVNAPSLPLPAMGSLVVNLSPAGAISAGAQWQVDGTGYNGSGQVAGYLTPGSHTISFKPISAYTTPANQIVIINANAQTTASGTYSVIAPSTYTLTLNQGGVTGFIANQPSGIGNIYNAGAVVQLTANANFGYHFVNWSGDVSGTANPTSITMTGNKTVTANFTSGDPNLGTITVTIQPPEAAAAGVTWGFNDTDIRESGTSYSYHPVTVFAHLHGANGWVGVGGWVTLTAGQTSNYVFTASNTNGSVVGGDPRNYVTLAGSAGISGFTNAVGAAARFSGPWSVAVDTTDNIYVADSGNNVIRKINAVGQVTTFAGMAGSAGSTDDTGTNALFSHPIGIAVDASNNVYVADFNNSTIRKVTAGGSVTTLAGSAGSPGSADSSGGSPRFNGPSGVAVDTSGNVYVADNFNCTIRKITPGGFVSTLAGTAGTRGNVDQPGSAARFNFPSGVAVDNDGNVYVADTLNCTIRKITPAGAVSTFAGFAGSAGASDGAGTAARFSYPNGVAVDSSGNVYVADSNNHIIRKITPAGIVTTLAGLSGHNGTNDGVGSVVRFKSPNGLTVDGAGKIVIADGGNQTIRATQSLATKVDQFISFAPLSDKSAGDAPFSITATSSSGLPVYMNVLSGPADLDTTNMLTLLGAGTVSVIAWQPGNSNYNAATPVLRSFNISKIPQAITFGALSQQKVGDAPFSLYATSDAGLPVSFSVSGPAVLNGNILTLTDWGIIIVTASQAGNASYMAATNVVQSFFVVPAENTIVAPQKLSSGNFQLAFYGLTGSNYLVQASTNLVDWQPFTNFTGANFLLYFNDSSATNFKQRFYRILMP